MLWLLAVCLADEAFCLEEELFFVVRQFALELLGGIQRHHVLLHQQHSVCTQHGLVA